MERALIERIIEHYLNPERAWMFGTEVIRAMAEFMGEPTAPMPPHASPYFADWFLFDFRFTDGQIPLIRYRGLNPHSLGEEELALLDEIAAHNRFDFFQVKKLHRKYFDADSVRSGDRFRIEEKPETSINLGDIVVTRLARMGGAWRIVSLDTLGMPNPSARDLARMQNAFPVLDPRLVFQEIVAPEMADTEVSVDELEGGMAHVIGGIGHL